MIPRTRALGATLVALAALLPATPAATDEAAFTLGARASAAFPMGSILSDPGNGALLIDELVAVSIPLQLDAGVTLRGRWFVGAYGQYAWNVLQVGGCSIGQSCSVTGLRVGVQATYAFRDDGGPWAGLGTGWEWMFTSYSGASFSTRIDVSGWEYAIFQGGWDVRVAPGWAVGPYLSASIGEFTRATRATGGETVESSIPNRALHGWLQFGVRGSFSL